MTETFIIRLHCHSQIITRSGNGFYQLLNYAINFHLQEQEIHYKHCASVYLILIALYNSYYGTVCFV